MEGAGGMTSDSASTDRGVLDVRALRLSRGTREILRGVDVPVKSAAHTMPGTTQLPMFAA